MKFAQYIEDTLPNMQGTPMDTVIEFVEVYNKWAQDCHRLVKADRTKLSELVRSDSAARKTMQEIYKKYCTLKNRQYHRGSKGYFFYGGTYNSSSEIKSCTSLAANKMIISTEKIKSISTAKRYTVIKQGEVWKIDAVESLAGDNKWVFDIL